MKFRILPAVMLSLFLSIPLLSASDDQKTKEDFLSEEDFSAMAAAVSETPQMQMIEGASVEELKAGIDRYFQRKTAYARREASLSPAIEGRNSSNAAMSYQSWLKVVDISSDSSGSHGIDQKRSVRCAKEENN